MENPTAGPSNDRNLSASTGVLLILILLAAAFMRINGLGEADLGFDETMHTYAALGILDHGEPIMPSGFAYRRALPFTYSVVLSFKIFGVSEWAARVPSVAFGLMTVFAVFWMGRYFFGTTAGIIAALLAAFLPVEIVQSRACRMYSMYQFLFLLSVFAFYRGIEGPAWERPPRRIPGLAYAARWGVSIPFLALSGILLYITYTVHALAALFYFSVAGYFGFMLIHSLVLEGWGGDGTRRYLLFFLLWMACGMAAFAFPGIQDTARTRLGFKPAWANHLQPYPGYYYGFFQSESLYPVLVFFTLGAVQICSRLHKGGYYLLACTGVPLFVHSCVLNVQKPRYIFDIFALILLVASYAIANFITGEAGELRSRLRKRARSAFAGRLYFLVAASLCLAALLLPFYTGLKDGLNVKAMQAYTFGGQYNAAWHKACAYVERFRKKQDVVIASIPLAAEFSGCGKIAYNLDNGEIDQFIKLEGERWQRHIFADAKCIIDLQDLQEVVSGHERGWIIADAQRFGSPSHVKRDVREFIRKNMVRHVLDGVDSIYIYSWDRGSGD